MRNNRADVLSIIPLLIAILVLVELEIVGCWHALGTSKTELNELLYTES